MCPKCNKEYEKAIDKLLLKNAFFGALWIVIVYMI